jgi:hypothetical protein
MEVILTPEYCLLISSGNESQVARASKHQKLSETTQVEKLRLLLS